MRLLDSNIVIYAVQPAHDWLRWNLEPGINGIQFRHQIEAAWP